MASAVVIWLHGLGDNGPANEGLQGIFTQPFMKGVKWVFPSAPHQRVTVNNGAYCPSWFDISDVPVVAQAPELEADVMKAVRSVHVLIDQQVAEGVSADKIFVCGFSQGGALSLASSMLYPEKLAGAGVFSCWVPLNPEFTERITDKAKTTPVLWQHGTKDNVVAFSAAKAGEAVLTDAGVNVEFKAHSGLGHSILHKQHIYLEKWIGVQLQKSS